MQINACLFFVSLIVFVRNSGVLLWRFVMFCIWGTCLENFEWESEGHSIEEAQKLRSELYQNAEKITLPSLTKYFSRSIVESADFFNGVFEMFDQKGELLFHRVISSALDTFVDVVNSQTRQTSRMMMLGSNNYLGFANNQRIKNRVIQCVQELGVGMAGPMLLNGTSQLHRQLEIEIAKFKGKEDAILLPSGYMTNLSWVSTLLGSDSVLIYDEVSHASVVDGIKLGKIKKALRFQHNDPKDLEVKLQRFAKKDRDCFVSIQGLYSMNGELAPLKEIADLCEKYGAHLVVDDAHGTGVMGNGHGTAEHFGVGKKVFLSMGTFSKAFSVTGGFLAGSKKIINFIRFYARPYFFTASLAPTNVAAILEGINIIREEPDRIRRLHSNADFFRSCLRDNGIKFLPTDTPIIPVFPPRVDMFRELALEVHKAGLFINAIEPPGVVPGGERFRVSVTSEHQKQDLTFAAEKLKDVFSKYSS